MRFTVHVGRMEDVVKRLDRIAKKAGKYGVPFAYRVSDEYPATATVRSVDPEPPHYSRVVGSYTVAAVDFDVECDELIRASGWTVCAKIEHGEGGNIVTPLGGNEVDESWYSAPARCDHCGTKRFRSVTFMCRNAEGEIRQVGRNCLKDYTGIDPALALMWAEVRDVFPDGMDCDEREFGQMGYERMFPTAEVIAHAVEMIGKYGYRRSDSEFSTREAVRGAVDRELGAEAMKKAEEIVSWLSGIGDGVVGIERDCAALARSGWAKPKHFGRLCYMPIAYERHLEKMKKEEEKAAHGSSDFVGNIGDRVTISAVEARLLTSWETQYGVTYLYRFVDAAGNVFIWKASRAVDVKDGMEIKGTVKDHDEYGGEKQTVVTRCKVA